MKKLFMFVVVLVAFTTLFAQEGKLHMTPKVGLGFAFSSWNMIGITGGFDVSYRVLTIKKKPGMGLYVGGEADFIAWLPIGAFSAGTNFEIPLLGGVRFQIPVKKVMIIPFVQMGATIMFRTNNTVGVLGTGKAGGAFTSNFGAEFVFKKKIVLRPYFKASAGWWGTNYNGAFMVDIGYRISK